MKKFLVLILSAIMCLSLFGCKDKEQEQGGNVVDFAEIAVNQSDVTVEVRRSVNVFVEKIDAYTGNDTYTWVSEDESVAKVEAVSSRQTMTGRILGKKVGTTKVTVTAGNGKSATINVTVEPYLASTANDVTLTIGDTSSFPITSTKGFTFTSLNDKIASVGPDGAITAIAPGRTILTAVRGQRKFNVAVQVNKASVMNLVLNESGKDKASLPVAAQGGYTYSSEDSAIASVNALGEVSAVGGGETKVVAMKNGVSYTYEVAVVPSKSNTLSFGEEIDEKISVYGRTDYQAGKGRMFYFAPAGFDVTFYGTELKADMYSESNEGHYSWLSVFVDGEAMTEESATDNRVVRLAESGEATLVSGLAEGWHTVKVRKRTPYISGGETWDAFGVQELRTDGYFGYTNNKSDFRIDVYGDSISCGYGNLTDGNTNSASTTDGVMAWESILAHGIGADLNVAAASGWGIAYDSSCDSKDKIASENASKWNLWTKDNAYDKLTPNHSATGYAKGADLILINLGTNDYTGINAGGDKNYVSKKMMYWLFDLKALNPQTPIVSMYGMMGTNGDTQNCLKAAVNAVQGAIVSLTNAKASGVSKEEAIQTATALVDSNVKINDAGAIVGQRLTAIAELIYADTAVAANVYYFQNAAVNGGKGHPLVEGHKQAASSVLDYLMKNQLIGIL